MKIPEKDLESIMINNEKRIRTLITNYNELPIDLTTFEDIKLNNKQYRINEEGWPMTGNINSVPGRALICLLDNPEIPFSHSELKYIIGSTSNCDYAPLAFLEGLQNKVNCSSKFYFLELNKHAEPPYVILSPK